MDTTFKKIVSICLISALLSTVGTTALTAQAEETDQPQTAANGLQIDENGDVIVEYDEDLATGALEVDINDIDDEHRIGSVEDYKEFANIQDAPKSRRSLKAAASTTLPDAVDNSTNENSIYFPQVDTQGAIGSCVAWATTYYQYTYTANRSRGVPTTRDNTYAPMWTYNFCNDGHDGGTNAGAVYDTLSKIGAVTVNDVPNKTSKVPSSNYTSWHANDDIWEHASHNRISGYSFFTSKTLWYGMEVETNYPVPFEGTPVTSAKDSDLDAMKTALNNGDIISITTYFTSWKYKTIKHSNNYGVDNSFVGQIAAYVCDGFNGSHQMTMVGYNDNIWIDINNNNIIDNGEMGAFKIANSWGQNNGNNGFHWVAYDALNDISSVLAVENGESRNPIFRSASTITVENKDYSSGLFLRAVLNTSARSESEITVSAVAKDGSGESYEEKLYPYNSIYFDGDYDEKWNVKYLNYNGGTEAEDGQLYYDLNQLIPDITRDTINNYNWTFKIEDTQNNSHPLIVKELEVIDTDTGDTFDVLSGQTQTLNGQSYSCSFSNIVLNTNFSATVTVSPKVNFGVAEIAHVNVEPHGGKGPYTYRYELFRYGETTLVSDWTSSSSIDKQLYEIGPYYFKVTVKDSVGHTTTAEDNVTVNTTYVMALNADKATARKGETVVITPTTHNLASVIQPSDFHYTVTNTADNTSATYTANSNTDLSWTPAKAGTYKIDCDIIYNSQKIAHNWMNYTVTDNSAVIYYKGYSNPYIHYQVGSGSWTAVPGVAMTPDTSVSGYTHKYTIDLGSSSYANVCFNNGCGSWDSNNGSNYRFEAGYYKYSNGVLTKFVPEPEGLSANLTLSKTEALSGQTISLTADASNGTTPYQYKFTYIKGGSETIIRNYSSASTTTFSPSQTGTYTVKLYVKDAAGTVASSEKTLVVKSPYISAVTANKTSASVGDTVVFSMNVGSAVSGLVYSYKISNGTSIQSLTTSSDNTASWTASTSGTYTVTGYISYNGETLDSATLTYTVTEAPVNRAVIYYKGYSAPYIHYQVGSGSWTAVPGVAMTPDTSISGYTHKYTIDLGSSSYANVCFNNGSGNWDSNNGANYRFEAGYYKYSNGVLTKFEPEPDNFTVALTLSPSESITNAPVTIQMDLSNGNPLYSYTMSYSLNGGDDVVYFSAYTSQAHPSTTFTPDTEGLYTFTLNVKDYSGNTASATKNLTVRSPRIDAVNTNISSAKAGQTVRINISSSNTISGLTYRYTIIKNNVETLLSESSSSFADWTPSEAGSYQIKGTLLFNGTVLDTRTINYTVSEPDPNTITIYYKGYSTPYIHYQVGNGSWTAVPGVAMTPDTTFVGYTHKYTIRLGSASYANVCFNDGHGNWDSRNGANYRFEKGTYTFHNGNITVR